MSEHRRRRPDPRQTRYAQPPCGGHGRCYSGATFCASQNCDLDSRTSLWRHTEPRSDTSPNPQGTSTLTLSRVRPARNGHPTSSPRSRTTPPTPSPRTTLNKPQHALDIPLHIIECAIWAAMRRELLRRACVTGRVLSSAPAGTSGTIWWRDVDERVAQASVHSLISWRASPTLRASRCLQPSRPAPGRS